MRSSTSTVLLVATAIALVSLPTTFARGNAKDKIERNSNTMTPQDIAEDAEATYNRSADAVNIFAVAIGAFLAIVGYRYKRTSFFLLGFSVTGAFGFLLVDTITDGTSYEAWAPIVAGIVGGLVVGVITSFIVKIGVFSAGAGLGVVLAILLHTAVLHKVVVTPTNLLLYIAMGVFGLVLGGLALKFERKILIASTSFVGAFLAVYGVGHFAGGLPSPFNLVQAVDATTDVSAVPFTWWIYLGALVVGGVAAVCLQVFVTGRKREEGVDSNRPLHSGMSAVPVAVPVRRCGCLRMRWWRSTKPAASHHYLVMEEGTRGAKAVGQGQPEKAATVGATNLAYN